MEEPVPVAEPEPAPVAEPAPDRDGDGIADDVDACADEPGLPGDDVARHGCPALAEQRADRIELHESVLFEVGKDRILPESDPLLGEVARILREHPEIAKVTVEGHTDASGDRAKNLALSQRRAEVVKRWLIDRGEIDPSRVAAKGHGPDRPIASNRTAEGKAKNRRVEVRIAE